MEVKRKESFIFRLSPNEKKMLEIMALQEGRSLSAMLREFIREGMKSRGLLFKNLTAPDKPEALNEAR